MTFMRWGSVAFVVLLSACSHPAAPPPDAPAPQAATADLSGTYVAGGKDPKTQHYFVEALRLTPSGPGQFSGSFEATNLDGNGKVTSTTQNVTGTTDGTQVTITFDQGFGHMNRTGTVDAGGLTLSWLDNGQLNHEPYLKRSDAEYGKMLDAVKQGSNILTAQAQQQQAAAATSQQATQLVDRIDHFLQKFPTWSTAQQQDRHDHAMKAAQAALEKVRHLMTGDDVAKSQAQVEVFQMQVFHNQLGLDFNATRQVVSATRSKLAEMDTDVKNSPCLTPDGALVPNAVSGCEALPVAVQSYREVRPKADAMLTQIETMDQQTDTDFVNVLHEAEQDAGLPLHD